MRQLSLLLALLLAGSYVSAQKFTIDGEFRPRTEFSHGYSTLADSAQDWSVFTSQRTRLNFGWEGKGLSTYLSLQDVRTWGSQPQLVGNEANGVSIHEGWAEGALCEGFSLRVGRQELKYDNHRIFGNVGWAQQARSHDLALLKYKGKVNAHLGIAYHENTNRTNNIYDGPDAYKAMQFLWLNHKTENLELSFLFLNNGIPYIELDSTTFEIEQKIRYSQTAGPYFKWGKDKIGIEGNAYLQVGKDAAGKELSGYEAMVMGTYKVCEEFSAALGFEMLSGTAYDEIEKNNSFTPLYGTNHKFNGFMDYFYVGNHSNTVGLNDIFLKLSGKIGKATLMADIHSFSANAEIAMDTEKGLGTEIDLTLKYPLGEGFGLTAGYSRMFATESLELIKGGDMDEAHQWGYLMLTFTPTFLKSE